MTSRQVATVQIPLPERPSSRDLTKYLCLARAPGQFYDSFKGGGGEMLCDSAVFQGRKGSMAGHRAGPASPGLPAATAPEKPGVTNLGLGMQRSPK